MLFKKFIMKMLLKKIPAKINHIKYLKGMLRPIFCIDINTRTDRK